MSSTLLVMFLLNILYTVLGQSLVRRQILHCLLSFCLGTISTAMMINSFGGIFSKGIDIGTDTFGKL